MSLPIWFRNRASSIVVTRPKRHARPPIVEALENRDTPSTYLVTTTADAGAGSLRAAIVAANSHSGADRIEFAIPTLDAHFVDANNNHQFNAGDYWSIAPASPLPAISQMVTVDGWSQRGPNYRGQPVIELTGASAGGAADGLTLSTHKNSTVRGLVINNFKGNGLAISGGGRHELVGNFIGTDATGQIDRGNKLAGVSIVGSSNNDVGGTGRGERNVISGNDLQGIHIEGAASEGNHILGNLIGTKITGDTALANGTEKYLGDGIRIEGGKHNVIGGDSAAERNVLSGNFDDGVDIRDGAADNAVQGNFIGTDITGRRPLGNGADGVYFQDASDNLIGGHISGDANVIGANGYNGVFLYGDSHDNVIEGNFIGTNSRLDAGLGNGVVAAFADGVFLAQFGSPQGPTNNIIVDNTIAFNADSAIAIDLDAGSNAVGNRILKNSIFGNEGVAIDLVSDGVTANDAGDADAGPNRRQNFPVLNAPTKKSNGKIILTGALDSTPNQRFRIEFFASADPGEGRVYLGSVDVKTDALGHATFTFHFKSVAGKPYLTATATNRTTGDTSEFSAAVQL